jgi:galactose oxidase
MDFVWIVGRRVLTSCAILALALWVEFTGAQVAPSANPSCRGREVVVGITPSCPYGLKACWAGAYEALERLEGVDSVAALPSAESCTASVCLKDKGLPDPAKWASQFKLQVGQIYEFRGVEVTVSGTVERADGGLVLRVPELKQPITLGPLQHKLQWDSKEKAPRKPEPDELHAQKQLASKVKEANAEGGSVQVTGPLMKSKQGYILEVRKFIQLPREAAPRPEG